MGMERWATDQSCDQNPILWKICASRAVSAEILSKYRHAITNYFY